MEMCQSGKRQDVAGAEETCICESNFRGSFASVCPEVDDRIDSHVLALLIGVEIETSETDDMYRSFKEWM